MIQKKMILLVACAYILSVVLFYSATQIYLLPRFTELEREELRKNLFRFQDAFRNEELSLEKVAADWAVWDDSYQFSDGQYPDFIRKNMTDQTFANLQINFMVYLDRMGRLLYVKSFDLKTGKTISNPWVIRAIRASKTLRMLTDTGASRTGIVILNKKPVFITLHPLLNSAGQGPAHGSLIIGRFLNREVIKRMAAITLLPVAINPYSGDKIKFANPPADSRRHSVLIQTLPRGNVSGYVFLSDLSGRPVLIAKINQPSTIYKQGQSIIYFFMFVPMGIGLVVAPIMLFLLRRTVASRLAFLNQYANQIAASNDLSIRIPCGEPDEFTNFINIFNQMLANLEQSRKELEEKRQELAEIIDFLPDPTFVIDQKGQVTAWNRAIVDLTGFTKEEMIGKGESNYAIPFYGQIRPLLIDLINSPEQEVRHFYEHFEKKGVVLSSEGYLKMPHQPRDLFMAAQASPIYNSQGVQVGAIETIKDISQRKRTEEELKYLSLYDPLTGLYNRANFEKEIRRYDSLPTQALGIIVCDIDGLKTVNDTLGHGAGDRLIQKAATVIRGCFQPGDFLARIGGDEFIALLPQATASLLAEMGLRIQSALQEANQGGSDLPLHISIGWSLREESGQPLQDVLKKADENMYRQKLLHNQSARSASIQNLFLALGARELKSDKHSEHLEKLVAALAKKLSFSNQQIHHLRLLVQFHDIGKAGIPEQILFKPGPLDAEERNIMKRHTEIGYNIAQAARELSNIAEWILMHHEWWNGNGYPCGKKGEEIPVESRMMSIIDAYDAMTNDRPYRKAVTPAEALSELRRCAGIQFDPQLVTEFISIIEKEMTQ